LRSAIVAPSDALVLGSALRPTRRSVRNYLEEFDERRLTAYGVGSLIVLPGDQAHFHWAKSGEYVTQVTAIGPLGLTYVHPADDPRGQHSAPHG
jgi:hypothetical protein